jgi:hypothetical protein
MASYANTSPYATTSQSNGYLDIATPRAIPIATDDVYWMVTSQYKYRPDLLAFDLYQDSKLWWVFAVRNKDTIKDPVYDMIPGTEIFLPKATTLKRILGI